MNFTTANYIKYVTLMTQKTVPISFSSIIIFIIFMTVNKHSIKFVINNCYIKSYNIAYVLFTDEPKESKTALSIKIPLFYITLYTLNFSK